MQAHTLYICPPWHLGPPRKWRNPPLRPGNTTQGFAADIPPKRAAGRGGDSARQVTVDNGLAGGRWECSRNRAIDLWAHGAPNPLPMFLRAHPAPLKQNAARALVHHEIRPSFQGVPNSSAEFFGVRQLPPEFFEGPDAPLQKLGEGFGAP